MLAELFSRLFKYRFVYPHTVIGQVETLLSAHSFLMECSPRWTAEGGLHAMGERKFHFRKQGRKLFEKSFSEKNREYCFQKGGRVGWSLFWTMNSPPWRCDLLAGQCTQNYQHWTWCQLELAAGGWGVFFTGWVDGITQTWLVCSTLHWLASCF